VNVTLERAARAKLLKTTACVVPVCAETAAKPPAIKAPVTAVGAAVNCVPLADVDAVKTVRAIAFIFSQFEFVELALDAKVLVASTFVIAKFATLLTNVTSAVPELLRTEANPVVPTEPINDPADKPPTLKTLALPAAAKPVAAANVVVLACCTSMPYKDTDQFVLDAEKLIMFPTTYSPPVVLVPAKVIGWMSRLDHPPWTSVKDAEPATVEVPVVQDQELDVLITDVRDVLFTNE